MGHVNHKRPYETIRIVWWIFYYLVKRSVAKHNSPALRRAIVTTYILIVWTLLMITKNACDYNNRWVSMHTTRNHAILSQRWSFDVLYRRDMHCAKMKRIRAEEMRVWFVVSLHIQHNRKVNARVLVVKCHIYEKKEKE